MKIFTTQKSIHYFYGMKILYYLLIIIGLGSSCQNNTPKASEPISNTENTIKYDSVLAKQFGADEYGMKPYVMAFLKEGPNRDVDSTRAQEIFVAHMKNIDRMAENGDLVLAGPFFDSGELKGMYIFNVSSIKEAEALTKTDPAIKSGYLIMELHQWYGSAALMGVNEWHKTLAKKGVI